MVAVPAPAKVLVSGTNGYVAVWVAQKYLEAGYSVRGTVRSATKSAFLKDTFAKYGDRFELVVVEDITKDGAFDEAVKGVDAIAHTASPFHFNVTEPEAELITPAVKGTTGILNSALRHGSTVKRIVITSSVVAVWTVITDSKPHTFSENDWNDDAVERVKAHGKDAGAFHIYGASKTLAERAAWDFVAAHKSEISWDLVTINPPYIFGPSLTPAPGVDDINTSQRLVYDTLTGARKDSGLKDQASWAHVKVVAEAHVRAINTPAAGDERFIVNSGAFFYQDILDAAAQLGVQNVPRGEPDSTKGIPILYNYKTTKAADILGLKPEIPLKDMVDESIKDFKARGYPGFEA
ncbi:D-lactaldehyde dehydrogenase [Gloeopeniophorella convolvens]|nr:D-lactaldehyde dehydrogenase [Gloeopeniophorella convolvens]